MLSMQQVAGMHSKGATKHIPFWQAMLLSWPNQHFLLNCIYGYTMAIMESPSKCELWSQEQQLLQIHIVRLWDAYK